MGEEKDGMIAMLPAAFCWTRYGTESGMDVPDIIRRKEMERQVAGMFCWGIGNALGAGMAELCRRTPEAVAVFSAMASRAAAHDASPDGVVVWRAYRDANGSAVPLPPGVLVTSREKSASGRRPARYYGLFCASSDPLAFREGVSFSFDAVRNLTTGNPVGGSQTTAIVGFDAAVGGGRTYVASLVANLVQPYYAEMLDPLGLSADDILRVHAAARRGDPAAWLALVTDVRREPG
jgi:hypothetical protein